MSDPDHIQLLTHIVRIELWVTAICTTAFPILYSFSNWKSLRIGRIMMLFGISVAVAMDTTLLFQYWAPTDVLTLFTINTLVFGLIAVSSTLLTWKVCYLNYMHREPKHYD